MAAVPQCRQFSSACELVARDWRTNVESPDEWTATTAPGALLGESQGYLVTCGAINAYVKPSKKDKSALPVPRAAHEKIAADLAQDLGLPVAPAILKRWAAPPHGDETCAVCVLVPFHPSHKWDAVKAVPGLEATLKQGLRIAASSMVAFDTWLGNTDRANGGNVLVNQVTAGPGPAKLNVAYLDFSYSMSHAWRPDFRTVTPVGVYPTDPPHIDRITVEWVVSSIEGLSEETIRTVVSRIPVDFLPVAAATVITDGLLYRQSRVRDALKSILGATP
jgi:hypothetical protein